MGEYKFITAPLKKHLICDFKGPLENLSKSLEEKELYINTDDLARTIDLVLRIYKIGVTKNNATRGLYNIRWLTLLEEVELTEENQESITNYMVEMNDIADSKFNNLEAIITNFPPIFTEVVKFINELFDYLRKSYIESDISFLDFTYNLNERRGRQIEFSLFKSDSLNGELVMRIISTVLFLSLSKNPALVIKSFPEEIQERILQIRADNTSDMI